MRRALPLFFLWACNEPSPSKSLLDEPLAPFPDRFQDVGLFHDGEPDARARAYTPLYELWSDGLAKQRYIVAPDLITDWSFPAGTLFFKTFSSDEPVETRVIRKSPDGFDYAVYRYDVLLDLTTDTDVPVGDFSHVIPSRLGCRTCHEASPSVILGFNALQLADALPDLAGLFAAAPEPERIPDSAAHDVLGWAQGNCTHCHNGSEIFDLRYPVFVDNTVNHATEVGAPGLRITPGSPADSILFLAVSGETDDPEVPSMPPLGVAVRDADAIAVLRQWIEDL